MATESRGGAGMTETVWLLLTAAVLALAGVALTSWDRDRIRNTADGLAEPAAPAMPTGPVARVDVAKAEVGRAADELLEMAARRFDVHGFNDAYGAATWDAACFLREDFIPSITPATPAGIAPGIRGGIHTSPPPNT